MLITLSLTSIYHRDTTTKFMKRWFVLAFWIGLAKGCEESAHKTFNNVTETLKFSTPTPAPTASNSISND
jgi:hypothetical protein